MLNFAVLRSCPAPVFYLASSRDEVVPAGSVADILRVRPSVRGTTLDESNPSSCLPCPSVDLIQCTSTLMATAARRAF